MKKSALLLIGGLALVLALFAYIANQESSVATPLIKIVLDRSFAMFATLLRITYFILDVVTTFVLSLTAYVSAFVAKHLAWQSVAELLVLLVAMAKAAMVRVVGKKSLLTLLSWILTLRFKAKLRRSFRLLRIRIVSTVQAQKKVILWWRRQPLWIKMLSWFPILLFIVFGGVLLAAMAGLIGLGNLSYIFPWFGWRLPMAFLSFFWVVLRRMLLFVLNFILTRFLPGKLVERFGSLAFLKVWNVLPKHHREHVERHRVSLLRRSRRMVAKHRNIALLNASRSGRTFEEAILRLRRMRAKKTSGDTGVKH